MSTNNHITQSAWEKMAITACAGLADPVADLQAMRDELDELKSGSVHSCSNSCQRPGCIRRRENEAMRAAIKAASGHLAGFLGFHSDELTNAQVRSIFDCITSLQPFAKP